MALAPGSRIGSYEVVSLLGAGGMGEVYRATDVHLKRQVALKVLSGELAHAPDRVARFQREAELLAALNHRSLAHLYGVEKFGADLVLVMELVEGDTLADRIARGPMPLQQAVPIAIQIAEALEAAHEQGIVHRDLKPANVKVRDDGTVKVLDFGLAKAVGPSQVATADLTHSPTISIQATANGVILGTAAYMSPEQAAGRPVDKRTDLWAFGVVLFEMLAGHRPFDGASVTEVLAAVTLMQPDWSDLPADTPPAVSRIIRRCLEKDRKKRLDSAADLRNELEEALASPTPMAQAVAPASAPRARRVPLLALAAAVCAGAVAGVAGMWLRTPTLPKASVTRLELTTPPTPASYQFALSPDGRRVAFVAAIYGPRQIWVRDLDQAVARPLPGTDGGSHPFWAPNGRALGFFAGGKLKRVELTGGSPVELAEVALGLGGAWNADDVIVFAVNPTSGLMRTSAKGGTPTPATHLTEGRTGHRWPQFLPDGRHFIFLASGPGQQGAIAMASLDDPTPVTITDATAAGAYAPPGYLLRVVDGVLVSQRFDMATARLSGDPIPLAQDVGQNDGTGRSAFAVSWAGVLAHRGGAPGGQRQLVWFDRAGKALGTVGPPDAASPNSFALAPDDRHIANARTIEGNYDIWLTDAVRPALNRFSFDPSPDYSPVFSPDSTKLIFRAQNRKGFGPSDLFLKPVSGTSDEVPLPATPEPKTALDWSRDGRFLLYSQLGGQTQSDLWLLPLEPTGAPVPLLRSSADETQGQLSPDGRWLVYVSNESGREEVYVRPVSQSSGKWQASAAGGSQPRWASDGKELFYIAADATLTAVPFNPSPAESPVGTPTPLFPTRLASGAGISLTGWQSRALYAVARDGRFLLNIAADPEVARPIAIVEHWDTLVK